MPEEPAIDVPAPDAGIQVTLRVSWGCSEVMNWNVTLRGYDEYRRGKKRKEYQLIKPSDPDPAFPDHIEDNPHSMPLKKAIEYVLEMLDSDGKANTTLAGYETKLTNFCEWLIHLGKVEETAHIRRDHFQDYRRQRSRNVKKTTVSDDMDAVRVFVRRLEGRGAVADGLVQYVQSPTVSRDDETDDEYLEADRGDRILQFVRKYRPGSFEHVTFELAWASGIRLGGIHGLDVDNFDAEEGAVELEHLPGEPVDTPLKNATKGERWVSLSPRTVEAIEAYLDNPDRNKQTDEDGRHPLLTTEQGRASRSHIRETCYRLTHPCTIGDECPLDRDPEECSAHGELTQGSKCPDARSPHPIRSGAITRKLKRGTDPKALADRCDVELDTMEQHYNQMSEREKMRLRRAQFDDEFAASRDDGDVKDRLFE
jgi:integrase